MSTSGIVFSGLASGLDTQAIISALLAIERRPVQALQTKKASLQKQLGLFGDFESKLTALRDAADTVRKASNFLEFKADLDRTDLLNASASPSAVPGSYALVVNQLARAQSNQSGSYASDTTQLIQGSATSKLQFTINGTTTIDVDLTNASNSLQEVATQINSAAGQAITAQVMKVADSDYRLVVTGDQGAAASFTVAGSGQQDVIDLGNALNTNSLRSAQDASVDINGLTISRSTNSFSDAIPGVTLDLVSQNSTQTTQLTVSPDATATADKVKKFVDAYNAVVDFVEAQGALDEDGKPKSELFGDSTLRTIRSSLRSTIGGDAQTSNAAYTLFSQVGIDADRNGRLTFTQTEFEAAVAADKNAVEELFSGTTNGIASLVYTQTDDYLDTVDGLLVSRKNGFNTRIQDADRQIETAQRRLAATQISLERKFSNLEVLMNQLQGQGAALGGILPVSR